MNRTAKIIFIVQTGIVLLYAGLAYNSKCEAEIQANRALINLEEARINQQEAEKQAARAHENQAKANAAAAAAMKTVNKLEKCKNGE